MTEKEAGTKTLESLSLISNLAQQIEFLIDSLPKNAALLEILSNNLADQTHKLIEVGDALARKRYEAIAGAIPKSVGQSAAGILSQFELPEPGEGINS